MNKAKNGGFTLLELLFVFAILCMLAAVAVPAYSRHMERAREVADLCEIRNAYTEAMAEQAFSASSKVTIEGVKLTSSGKFKYIDTVGLPFGGLKNLTVTKGLYNVTFDLTKDKPLVTVVQATAAAE